MALIIDGYNLMHAAGILGHGVGPGSLERSRLAVLNFIAESLEPADLAATVVVFDAQNAPPGLPPALTHRGVAVRFAAGYTSADELIEDLIERDNTPRRLIVVSSDHRLHRAARRRKAQAVDSDRWYEQTIAARRARQKSSAAELAKPAPPFANSEVEYWLQRFADLSDADSSAKKPAAGQPAARASKQQPTASLPKVSLPKVSLPKVSLPKVSLPKVSLPNASPSPSSPPPASKPIPQATDRTLPDAILDETSIEEAGDPIFPREYLESIERELED